MSKNTKVIANYLRVKAMAEQEVPVTKMADIERLTDIYLDPGIDKLESTAQMGKAAFNGLISRAKEGPKSERVRVQIQRLVGKLVNKTCTDQISGHNRMLNSLFAALVCGGTRDQRLYTGDLALPKTLAMLVNEVSKLEDYHKKTLSEPEYQVGRAVFMDPSAEPEYHAFWANLVRDNLDRIPPYVMGRLVMSGQWDMDVQDILDSNFGTDFKMYLLLARAFYLRAVWNLYGYNSYSASEIRSLGMELDGLQDEINLLIRHLTLNQYEWSSDFFRLSTVLSIAIVLTTSTAVPDEEEFYGLVTDVGQAFTDGDPDNLHIIIRGLEVLAGQRIYKSLMLLQGYATHTVQVVESKWAYVPDLPDSLLEVKKATFDRALDDLVRITNYGYAGTYTPSGIIKNAYLDAAGTGKTVMLCTPSPLLCTATGRHSAPNLPVIQELLESLQRGYVIQSHLDKYGAKYAEIVSAGFIAGLFRGVICSDHYVMDLSGPNVNYAPTGGWSAVLTKLTGSSSNPLAKIVDLRNMRGAIKLQDVLFD